MRYYLTSIKLVQVTCDQNPGPCQNTISCIFREQNNEWITHINNRQECVHTPDPETALPGMYPEKNQPISTVFLTALFGIAPLCYVLLLLWLNASQKQLTEGVFGFGSQLERTQSIAAGRHGGRSALWLVTLCPQTGSRERWMLVVCSIFPFVCLSQDTSQREGAPTPKVSLLSFS